MDGQRRPAAKGDEPRQPRRDRELRRRETATLSGARSSALGANGLAPGDTADAPAAAASSSTAAARLMQGP